MDHLYQLLTGDVILHIDGIIFFIRPPTSKIKQVASFYAGIHKKESFELNNYTLEEAIALGHFSLSDNELLEKTLPKIINETKKKYFHNFYFPSRKDSIKRELEKLKEEMQSLYSKKFIYYQQTCDYIYDSFFQDYCLENCLYNNDEKVKPGTVNLMKIRFQYNKNKVTSDEVREVSKTKDWKLLWSASKDNQIFDKPLMDLSDSQIELINWSKTYDSVYQSQDVPPEEIIQDDIAFDGWLFEQSEKRKTEEVKNKTKNTDGKGDLFLPARSKKEVDEIISMNGTAGKKTIQSLASDLKNRGSLKESELTHVKQNIQMAINSAK